MPMFSSVEWVMNPVVHEKWDTCVTPKHSSESLDIELICPRGGPLGVAEPSQLPGGSGGARCLPPALRYRRDQVPPLLPLQLRPPPPPPSCMTQQNRRCCSKSQPSAQEAPQPGLGRGGEEGGEAGATVEGGSCPHLAPHTPLPARGTGTKSG